MFTGIIETTGEVLRTEREQGNLRLELRSSISQELAPGQSVSHQGACLTVEDVNGDTHTVALITETLDKTAFGLTKAGMQVNLERAMPANGRLDGHIVQGHVDAVATCERKTSADGSTLFLFRHPRGDDFITVPKGSVCVDGVSLTVVESGADYFSVAVIPFTLEHTSFGRLEAGRPVNVEFDIIGKYLRRLSTER